MLSEKEYTEQKKEDNTDERKEAKKWGLSVDELKLQQEMISKGNKKRDDTQKKKKKLDNRGERRASDPSLFTVGNTNQPLLPANLRHPSVASDPSLFTVGTMVDVQMMDAPPVHGIIKWMGTLPNYEGYYGGIELVCYII